MTFSKVSKATIKPGRTEEAKALHGGSVFPLNWIRQVEGVSSLRSQPPGGLEVFGPDPMPHHTKVYITATGKALEVIQKKLGDLYDFEAWESE